MQTPETLNIINPTSPLKRRQFCPSESINVFETIKDPYLFARNLTVRFIFDRDRQSLNMERELVKRTKHFTMQEFRALRDLMLHFDKGEADSPIAVTQSGSPPLTSPIGKNTGKSKISPARSQI